jgi:hypothetical protein
MVTGSSMVPAAPLPWPMLKDSPDASHVVPVAEVLEVVPDEDVVDVDDLAGELVDVVDVLALGVDEQAASTSPAAISVPRRSGERSRCGRAGRSVKP